MRFHDHSETETNGNRAEWARDAVQVFANITFGAGSYDADLDQPESMEQAMGDLIADMAHLADKAGLNFSETICAGMRRYSEETAIAEQETTPAAEPEPRTAAVSWTEEVTYHATVDLEALELGSDWRAALICDPDHLADYVDDSNYMGTQERTITEINGKPV